ncbi:unnamed protein product [Victoria cruziana]
MFGLVVLQSQHVHESAVFLVEWTPQLPYTKSSCTDADQLSTNWSWNGTIITSTWMMLELLQQSLQFLSGNSAPAFCLRNSSIGLSACRFPKTQCTVVSSFPIAHSSFTGSPSLGSLVYKTDEIQFLVGIQKFVRKNDQKADRLGRVHSLERTSGSRVLYGKNCKQSRGKTCSAWQRNINEIVAPADKSIQSLSQEKVFKYSFWTELGGQVKVLVRRKDLTYELKVEVSLLPAGTGDHELFLNWGMFRSDSSSWVVPERQSLPPGAICVKLESGQDSVQMPFERKNSYLFALSLSFKLETAPFYLSFVLQSQPNASSKGSWIRNHLRKNFCVPVGIGRGFPEPLGATLCDDDGMNFAIFSRNAETVVLCLYGEKGSTPSLEIELDPYVNRTGDIWHVSIENVDRYSCYGYQCKGTTLWDDGSRFRKPHVLLDPYAKIIRSLNTGQGVNAVLLEPIFPFIEEHGPYFPYHFFSPMNSYGPRGDGVSSSNSMKAMVKALHENQIEVLLEVIFTQTAEGRDSASQAISFSGIDNSSYYIVERNPESGAVRRLNCNTPVVQRMILDSLRHWVNDYHIDGFFLVDAASLVEGPSARVLTRSSLIEAIAFDPVLSKTKLIADGFSPSEALHKDISFPHWKRWAEVNPKFCYDIRKFLRGEGLLSNVATRLCGSGDLFSDGRGPGFSFNFIARNFGLSLVDLVCFSWNCGEEGASSKSNVLEVRVRQIRNFLFILYVSLGVPIVNMGDEYGQSTGGSSLYISRKSFDWRGLHTDFGIQTCHFLAFLSALRKEKYELFQRKNFIEADYLDWHGPHLTEALWSDTSSKFLSVTLKREKGERGSKLTAGDMYLAFNACESSIAVALPQLPAELTWFCLVDTALPYPAFFSMKGTPFDQPAVRPSYEMKSHSCALFEAQLQPHSPWP